MSDVEDATAGVKIESDDTGVIDTAAIPGALPGLEGTAISLGQSSFGLGQSVGELVRDPASDSDIVDVGLEAAGVLADTAGFVNECATMAGDIASDPLGWLVGQGLDFLYSVVTPLQDALRFVSGDGPALEMAAGNFAGIGEGLQSMAANFVEVADSSLADWDGDAASAARAALAEFTDGMNGVAAKSGNVAEILHGSSMLMTIVEEVIKAIITELVKWLIMIWVPALAAAIPTAGASTGAAGAATGVQAGMTGGRVSRIVAKLQQILTQIKNWLAKLAQTFKKDKVLNKALTKGAETYVKETAGIDVGSVSEGNTLGASVAMAKHAIGVAEDVKTTVDNSSIGEQQSDADVRRKLGF
jgi:hypothetical protein